MDLPEEEVKSMIRGVLTSSPCSMNIAQMLNDFESLVGVPIPFGRFGYSDIESYLRSIPDTVLVHGHGMSARLEVITTKAAHICKMVENQKNSSKKRRTSKRRKSSFYNTENISKVTPQVGEFFNMFQSKSSRYCGERSITTRTVTETYTVDRYEESHFKESRFNLKSNKVREPSSVFKLEYEPCDTLSHGHRSEVPPTVQKNSVDAKCSKSEICGKPEPSNVTPKKEQQSEVVTINKDYEYEYDTGFRIKWDAPVPVSEKVKFVIVKNEFPTKDTNVPRYVQKNLKLLLQDFPDGILCSSIANQYLKKFQKQFKYEKFRYTSLIELLTSLPHIVNYKIAGSSDFLIFTAGTTVPDYVEPDLEAKLRKEAEDSRQKVPVKALWEEFPNLYMNWSRLPFKVPDNVSRFGDTISIFFDRGWAAGDKISVQVGEIFDLSKFWISVDSTLETLMKDLQAFFLFRETEYSLPSVLIRSDLNCVAFYLNKFHRCCVIDLLEDQKDYVLVYFIDYGTTDVVSTKNCYYMPKEFASIPSQAVRARLSNILPPVENDIWSAGAVERFAELITDTKLLAEITEIEQDCILEIYLADVLDESDIYYINDVLVENGYAVYSHEERVKPILKDPDCIPLVKYLHLYPNFEELERGFFRADMTYIQNNSIPAHFYMSHYFQINLSIDDDAIDEIEKRAENFNSSKKKIKLNELEYEEDEWYGSYFASLEKLISQDDDNNEDNKDETTINQTGEAAEFSSAAKRRIKLMNLELSIESIKNSGDFEESKKKSIVDDDVLFVKTETSSQSWTPSESLSLYSNGSTAAETTVNRSSTRPFMLNLEPRTLPVIFPQTNPFKSTNPFLEDLTSIMEAGSIPSELKKEDIFTDKDNRPKEVKRIGTPPGFPSMKLLTPQCSTINNASQYVPITQNLPSTSGFNYNAPPFHPNPGSSRMFNSYTSQLINNNTISQATQYNELLEQLRLLNLYSYNTRPPCTPQGYPYYQSLPSALQQAYPGGWQNVAGALPPNFYQSK